MRGSKRLHLGCMDARQCETDSQIITHNKEWNLLVCSLYAEYLQQQSLLVESPTTPMPCLRGGTQAATISPTTCTHLHFLLYLSYM